MLAKRRNLSVAGLRRRHLRHTPMVVRFLVAVRPDEQGSWPIVLTWAVIRWKGSSVVRGHRFRSLLRLLDRRPGAEAIFFSSCDATQAIRLFRTRAWTAAHDLIPIGRVHTLSGEAKSIGDLRHRRATVASVGYRRRGMDNGARDQPEY